MLRGGAFATLAVAVVAVLPAAPAQAGPRYFRAKPTGITCGAFRLHKRSATLRCDLRFSGSRAVFLHTRGKAVIKRVPSFLHPRHRMVLRLGRTASLGGFSCTSRRTVLSCRTGGGHGFTVGRKFQLVF